MHQYGHKCTSTNTSKFFYLYVLFLNIIIIRLYLYLYYIYLEWVIIAQVVVAVIPFALSMLLGLVSVKNRNASDQINDAIDVITYVLGVFPSCAFATGINSLTECPEESLRKAFSWNRKLLQIGRAHV